MHLCNYKLAKNDKHDFKVSFDVKTSHNTSIAIILSLSFHYRLKQSRIDEKKKPY